MLATICALVCVLCVGNASSSSYIKSLVDMYRTMAPLASLPPLIITGLTDDEKQSLDGGLKFASGLTGMGSELLVTGANNASDVAHHGLQSVLHFAERAIIEGSKLATQGLDILEEIENKAPHYAGTIRNVMPLVGSRSLSDVRTDVASLHSKIIPALNHVVSNSHVLVDKVRQFVQKLVNVTNDILQIAISLAKMAVTGDMGDIEKYEKDLMLRTTGTTDPGLASSRLREALDPKNIREKVNSLATAYKHISSMSNYVSDAGNQSAGQSAGTNQGGTDISKAEKMGSVLGKAREYMATKYWNSSRGGPVTGDPGMSSEKQVEDTGINEASSDTVIEGKTVGSAAEGVESASGSKAPTVVIGETDVVVPTEVPTSIIESEDASTPNWVSHQVEETVNDLRHKEGPDPASRSLKLEEPVKSWSFFGMMLNAVKNTASYLKTAVIGGSPAEARDIQERAQSASAADSSDDSLSGARALNQGANSKNNDSEASNYTSSFDSPSTSESTASASSIDGVDSSNVSQMIMRENDIQVADDLAIPRNTVLGLRDTPHNAVDETQEVLHTTGQARKNYGDREIIVNVLPGGSEHINQKAVNVTSGAHGLERDTITAPSEMSVSASSNVIPSAAEQEATGFKENSVIESTVSQADSPRGTQGVILEDSSLLHDTEIKEDKILRNEANKNDVNEKMTAGQETDEPVEQTRGDHVSGENNSGARGLVTEANPEPKNNTNSVVTTDSESPSGLNFFGKLVQFVGKVANSAVTAVTETVAPEGARFVENIAKNVSTAEVESVTPEDTKFLENLASNITRGTGVQDGEDPSGLITGARDLKADRATSEIAFNTPESLRTSENMTTTGDEQSLKYPDALKPVTNGENAKLSENKVEEQLAKPGSVDQVNPESDNYFQAGLISATRSILDEHTDHANGSSMANSISSRVVPSNEIVYSSKDKGRRASQEVATHVKPADHLNGQQSRDNADSNPVEANESSSQESLISGKHTDGAHASAGSSQGKFDVIEDIMFESNANNDITSSRHRAKEPSTTAGAERYEQSPEHKTSSASSLDIEDPRNSVHIATETTRTGTSSAYTNPNSASVVMESFMLISPHSIIPGERHLATEGMPLPNADNDGVSLHPTALEPNNTAEAGKNVQNNSPEYVISREHGLSKVHTFDDFTPGMSHNGISSPYPDTDPPAKPEESHAPDWLGSMINGALGRDIEEAHTPTDVTPSVTSTGFTSIHHRPNLLPGDEVYVSLNSPESKTSNTDALDREDAYTTVPKDNNTASLTFTQPSPLPGTVEHYVLNSPDSTISSARGLEVNESAHGFVLKNTEASAAPTSTSGMDVFGKIVQIVGRVVNNTAAAVVETVAPESARFVENMASNVKKAVIESIAPEDKAFVKNLASNISSVVDGVVAVNADATPSLATIPSDDIIAGAKRHESDVPKTADSLKNGPIITGNSAVRANGNKLIINEAHTTLTEPEDPQIQLESGGRNTKTEEPASLSPDGGWIFVNVINSKPNIFVSPEGNPIGEITKETPLSKRR